MLNIENNKYFVILIAFFVILLFAIFSFVFNLEANAQGGCSQGASCNTGTASGAWFTCWGTCGQWPNTRNCTAPAVCCGNGGNFQCEPDGGCHTDCAGAPPQPSPPVCESLVISGNPTSNPNLTVNPNIQLNWTKSGGSPSNQKFSWGLENSSLASKDPINGDWGSYVEQPKNINLARDGSITQGTYKVRMDLRNADGETQCVDTIIYDNPPQILEVKPDPLNEFPGVNGLYGRWSGTFDDGDNNPDFNGGRDNNHMKFGIKVYDVDGINDIKRINFGVGPVKDQIPEDTYTSVSCDSDTLEKEFRDRGVGITFNLNEGSFVGNGWNHICGVVTNRFSISNLQINRLGDNKTAWIYFNLTFGDQMIQGFLDVWAKAMDSQGVWSGPDGIDKYQKFGFWGVDTQLPLPGEFGQKQPLNAKSVRVWWDGEDNHSGISYIKKGCEFKDNNGNWIDCNNLSGNWSPVVLANTGGSIIQYPLNVTSTNVSGVLVNYIEEIYTNPNLTGDEEYKFAEWITDGANNQVRADLNLQIGKSWLQIVQGDVFMNSMRDLITPAQSLDNQGYYQLLRGYSTAMFNSFGAGFVNTFNGVGRTDKVVSGSSSGTDYNYMAGLDTIFSVPTNANLFDRLKQEAIENGKVIKLCGRADQNPPCEQDERDEKLNDQNWIDGDGVYLFDIVGDTNILGIESNRWTNNSGEHSIILLVEGRDSIKNFGIIPSLDPNLNIIIMARNANIIFRTVGDMTRPNEAPKEHAFELDFLNKDSSNSPRYCNPAQGRPCYNIAAYGKRSGDEWDDTYRDKDTYHKYSDVLNNTYGANIIDPGLDVFGFFVISDNKVIIENEEQDYNNDLRDCIASGNCPQWDGDFERMEMRGGIVANRVEFKRNLVALDNSWIPSEKLIYGAQYIDAYVKAAKNVREQSMGFRAWEEVGLDY